MQHFLTHAQVEKWTYFGAEDGADTECLRLLQRWMPVLHVVGLKLITFHGVWPFSSLRLDKFKARISKLPPTEQPPPARGSPDGPAVLE